MNTKTYFYTRYAMTAGIYEVQAAPCESIPGAHSLQGRYYSLAYLGKDLFESWDDAVAKADDMRKRKIASLRKSIKKLELVTFTKEEI